MRPLLKCASSIALLLTVAISANAQGVQIPQYIKKVLPIDSYRELANEWEKHVAARPSDANGWWNYYKALRYSNFGADEVSKAKTMLRIEQLERDIAVHIPATFEYHHIKWTAGWFDPTRLPHLKQAEAMRPDDPELASNLIAYYETELDRARVKLYSLKWYMSRDLSSGLLEYNYNVLMSLEPNAILFTGGDLDTYPLWMLQYLKNVRTDVTVLNAGLLTLPSYRHAFLKAEGIEGDTECPDRTCLAAFYSNVAQRNTKRPVYFALTFGTHNLELIRQDLYTVGLAYKYSPKGMDNIALLKNNWTKFHLDYLDLQFYGETNEFNSGRLQSMNMNYVAPAMLLYEHYLAAGDANNARTMRELAIKLAREGAQDREVLTYIDSIDKAHAPIAPRMTKAAEDSHADDEKVTRHVITSKKIDGYVAADEVSIYPNPANTELTIKMPKPINGYVTLLDVDGVTFRTAEMKDGELTMKIDDLPSGAYVVRLRFKEFAITRTIQVVR